MTARTIFFLSTLICGFSAPAFAQHFGEGMAAFNAGDYALALNSKTDAEVVADAMDALRQVYGPAIPSPTGHLRTRWAVDPFAQGSYSFVAVGASLEDRDALAAAVADRLFFAGEATHRDHAATVHGAYLSGLVAASAM